jgi:hypothetical protein
VCGRGLPWLAARRLHSVGDWMASVDRGQDGFEAQSGRGGATGQGLCEGRIQFRGRCGQSDLPRADGATSWATARRQMAANWRRRLRPEAACADRSRRRRTGSCGSGRRRSAGPGRMPRQNGLVTEPIRPTWSGLPLTRKVSAGGSPAGWIIKAAWVAGQGRAGGRGAPRRLNKRSYAPLGEPGAGRGGW